MDCEQSFQEQFQMDRNQSAQECFPIDWDQVRVISVVGAGGKTGTILTLAKEFLQQGKRVAVTTTTHLQHPDGLREQGIDIPGVFVDAREFESAYAKLQDVKKQPFHAGGFGNIKDHSDTHTYSGAEGRLTDFLEERCVFIGTPQMKEGKIWKLSSPSESCLEKIKEHFDVVLIEADGARHCSVKAYGSHEPVCDPQSDLTIVVLGMSALGQRISDAVFRVERVCELLGKRPEDTLELEDYECLLTDPAGLTAGMPGKCVVLLNQANTKKRQQSANVLADKLTQSYGLMAGVANICIYPDRQEHYACILLAAGNSTRFGGNKLISVLDGKPMYQYALETIAPLHVKKILVTQYEEIAAAGKDYGFEVILNSDPEKGLSYSLQLGLKEAENVEGYLCCVCDQPKLDTDSLRDMLRLAGIYPGKIIASRRPDGGYANPNLIPYRYREELLKLSGDCGGKKVILNHEDQVIGYQIPEKQAIDIDTPADKEKMELYGGV